MELYDNLAKAFPLRPIKSVEEYTKACEVQEMVMKFEDRGPWAQLYLDALTVFMNAYERGLKP